MTNNEPTDANQPRPLGLAKRGYSGVIHRLAADEADSALSAVELESRLIELGFVEGARVSQSISVTPLIYATITAFFSLAVFRY